MNVPVQIYLSLSTTRKMLESRPEDALVKLVLTVLTVLTVVTVLKDREKNPKISHTLIL